MKIIGLLRARNGAVYLPGLLKQMSIFCDRILVLDNQSTDKTADVASSLGAEVRLNIGMAPHEGRDRIRLHNWAGQYNPDWVFSIETDELLMDGGPERIRDLVKGADLLGMEAFQFRYLYLWGDRSHYRADEPYQAASIRLFKYFPDLLPQNRKINSSPVSNKLIERGQYCSSNIRILNSGFMTPEQRLEKFDYYRINYPPGTENCRWFAGDDYRHILGRTAEIREV